MVSQSFVPMCTLFQIYTGDNLIMLLHVVSYPIITFSNDTWVVVELILINSLSNPNLNV